MTQDEFEEQGYREYIVTVQSMEDSESLYDDMETPGGTLFIPDRAIDCAYRRPISRNTHYWLFPKEADEIIKDPRVLDVSLHPRYLGIRAETYTTQYSDQWNKSGLTSSGMKNHGLLRCTEESSRSGWGSDGTHSNETATIYLSQIGRNVDIVVVDDSGVIPNHPDFAVNADGTGGTRVVSFDWYQYNPQVTGGAVTTYTYGSGSHNIHTQGTCGGNTQGWARGANIYNIFYYAGGSNNNFPYVFDYVRLFHKNKPINPTTGRKNPTICSSSWGMSLFPGEWANSDITAVTYRGVRYTPNAVTTYTGVNGVYTSSAQIMGLLNFENGGNRITTTGASTGTVSSLTLSFSNTTTLTSSTTPTSGNNDDGYWTINLPFTITYLGISYTTVYVGTNGYITFDGGSVVYSSLSATNPPLSKIMFAADDNSVQRIYHGVFGTSPSRKYCIKVEATAAASGGILGSPNITYEYVFYEATPNQIDLHCGVNARKSTGSFTSNQLSAWGIVYNGQVRIPQRVGPLDADLEDAVKDGIILCGAAGNGYWKHSAPGDQDWNNSFEMAIRYPASVSSPYYYMKGTSPTANDSKAAGGLYDIPNICVGSLDVTTVDQKATYSDCGPGVDIWSPGTNVLSTYPSGTADPRNGSYFISKLSGTSMACPQVTGVIACALELYPYWNQQQAKAYIVGLAKPGRISATTGGPTDSRDLQGAPNLHLYYKAERPAVGQAVPKLDNNPRPASGQVWPRTKTLIFK